ncbi:hypothetical protein [Streptomyces resistomycificus]|uniref:hypothetical protein n=1 Tax=Streptomyces resistomycificus TaxID=67356 RepID=UPI000AD2CC80|nr:hypothetical protein [Streptomyces resistomycificus]
MTTVTAAPVRADHQAPLSAADRAAHEAASYVRTAPLPPAAGDAMRSLERKLAAKGGA